MTKKQQELLDKCKKIPICEDIPLLDEIYILPTQKKHDSGYKIMYIVGKCNEEFYLLDTYCDVVEFETLFGGELIKELRIDILDNGIIRIFGRQKFKSIFRVSSCTFEMANDK